MLADTAASAWDTWVRAEALRATEELKDKVLKGCDGLQPRLGGPLGVSHAFDRLIDSHAPAAHYGHPLRPDPTEPAVLEMAAGQADLTEDVLQARTAVYHRVLEPPRPGVDEEPFAAADESAPDA